MIVDAIITIFYYFVYTITAPIRLLPDVSLPAEITQAIQTAGGYIANIEAVGFPAGALLTIFGIVLTIEVFIFTYKLIMWVVRKIPGVD